MFIQKQTLKFVDVRRVSYLGLIECCLTLKNIHIVLVRVFGIHIDPELLVCTKGLVGNCLDMCCSPLLLLCR